MLAVTSNIAYHVPFLLQELNNEHLSLHVHLFYFVCITINGNDLLLRMRCIYMPSFSCIFTAQEGTTQGSLQEG